MSGTYTGAYSTTKYPSAYIPEKKVKEFYTVVNAKHIDTYHYHGSWFEYTWDLKLIDSDGEETNQKMDTWDEHKQLSGKNIEYDGSIFKVVS